jgi:uncharacterized membrane protein
MTGANWLRAVSKGAARCLKTWVDIENEDMINGATCTKAVMRCGVILTNVYTIVGDKTTITVGARNVTDTPLRFNCRRLKRPQNLKETSEEVKIPIEMNSSVSSRDITAEEVVKLMYQLI